MSDRGDLESETRGKKGTTNNTCGKSWVAWKILQRGLRGKFYREDCSV